MESVQIIEAILHYMAEIALLGFSLYIFASHNKKAGAFLAVYSIFSLILPASNRQNDAPWLN